LPNFAKCQYPRAYLFTIIISGLIIFAAASSPLALANKTKPNPISRPRVGLVLSGGGARGAAHIGVLKVLEQLRVPVDCIAGTSMGAIVGGLYASGMGPVEIEKALNAIDWDHIFSDNPSRAKMSMRRKFDDAFFMLQKGAGFKDGDLLLPQGIIKGQKLYLKLKELTFHTRGITDFDKLDIPFRALACDIATGAAVVLAHGDLASAMRASMSIPGAFTPADIDGRLLVDGGVANNLPVDIARAMGAEVIIAVDISTPLLSQEKMKNLFDIVFQLTGLLTRRNAQAQLDTLSEKDILIAPDLGSISSGNFKRASEAVVIGQKAAQTRQHLLMRLSLNQQAYERHLLSRKAKRFTEPVIDFVKIDNNSQVADAVIYSKLTIPIGQPLDTKQLDEDLAVIYGMTVFDSVSYTIEEVNGKTGLKIKVREKPWAPNYLQLGLRFDSNFGDANNLAFRLGFLVTPVNRLNGEWRSVLELGDEPKFLSEFYQPLWLSSPYFIMPRLFYLNERYNIFDDNQIIAKYRVYTLGGSLITGRELGTWGEVQLGVQRTFGNKDLRVGLDLEPEDDTDSAEFFASLDADTLDNVFFPRSGLSARLVYTHALTELGADCAFQQTAADIFGAKSFKRNTFLLGARYDTTFDGEAPLQNRFRLGGLFELPGFSQGELNGQHAALARLGYLRAIKPVMVMPAYVGATLQYGNVFDASEDINFENGLIAASIFIGLDSKLGPLYFGYGYAQTGDNSLYFQLGKQF
jgi:NTE family protein